MQNLRRDYIGGIPDTIHFRLFIYISSSDIEKIKDKIIKIITFCCFVWM